MCISILCVFCGFAFAGAISKPPFSCSLPNLSNADRPAR